MNRRCVSSGAGQGHFIPTKASTLSTEKDCDVGHRRKGPMQKLKRKLVIVDDEEEENEVEEDRGRAETGNGGYGESEEHEADKATPIGDIVRVSGFGEQRVKHYRAFGYAGEQYRLEDPALLCPKDMNLKPYVVIIKDITENSARNMIITCQCFVRPEDAMKKGGGSWPECDLRELYYSFDLEEFSAETAMHTCVVNYVPLHKQLPNRRKFPGYIVQRVYDTKRKELYELTDKKFDHKRQLEINLLLNQTVQRIGHLPEQSKYQTILACSHALTDDSLRNYCLEKLLQSVEHVLQGGQRVIWPDSAISAITAIESALNKKFLEDISKYKEKIRQLSFNLKANPCLAQRVLKWELMPSVLLNMSPTELKEASTAEETEKQQPETHVRVQVYQMTDYRCRTCSERKVSVANKFNAGFRERYELECLSCGFRQFVSRDRVLTMELYESTEPKK